MATVWPLPPVADTLYADWRSTGFSPLGPPPPGLLSLRMAWQDAKPAAGAPQACEKTGALDAPAVARGTAPTTPVNTRPASRAAAVHTVLAYNPRRRRCRCMVEATSRHHLAAGQRRG